MRKSLENSVPSWTRVVVALSREARAWALFAALVWLAKDHGPTMIGKLVSLLH
jgi:hypothetical protein